MSNSTDWKTYLVIGASAALAAAVSHNTANVANASCSDKWATVGVAGAVGSLVGAYQAKGGSVVKDLKNLKTKLVAKVYRS